jgi:hypothetical protein
MYVYADPSTGLRLWYATVQPNALSRFAIALPIRPSPMMPTRPPCPPHNPSTRPAYCPPERHEPRPRRCPSRRSPPHRPDLLAVRRQELGRLIREDIRRVVVLKCLRQRLHQRPNLQHGTAQRRTDLGTHNGSHRTATWTTRPVANVNPTSTPAPARRNPPGRCWRSSGDRAAPRSGRRRPGWSRRTHPRRVPRWRVGGWRHR